MQLSRHAVRCGVSLGVCRICCPTCVPCQQLLPPACSLLLGPTSTTGLGTRRSAMALHSTVSPTLIWSQIQNSVAGEVHPFHSKPTTTVTPSPRIVLVETPQISAGHVTVAPVTSSPGLSHKMSLCANTNLRVEERNTEKELAPACSGTRLSQRLLLPLIQLTRISLFSQGQCTRVRRKMPARLRKRRDRHSPNGSGSNMAQTETVPKEKGDSTTRPPHSSLSLPQRVLEQSPKRQQ